MYIEIIWSTYNQSDYLWENRQNPNILIVDSRLKKNWHIWLAAFKNKKKKKNGEEENCG